MEETSEPELNLPQEIVDFVNYKLEANGKGRPHVIKQLGNMEKVLNLLSDAWIQDLKRKDLVKKYKVGEDGLENFLSWIAPFKEDVLAYLRQEEIKPKNFRAYPCIDKWEQDIRLSGHLSSLDLIRVLERICTGQIIQSFKCRPDKFDLEKAKEFIGLYLKETGKPKVQRSLRIAIRHFLTSRNIVIARGFGGQLGLSGEKDGYAKYGYVKFTEDQVTRIRKILSQDNEALENGFDIAFEIGFQTCARAFAIGSFEINKIGEEGKVVTIRLFEPKVKEGDEHLDHVGRYWLKYPSRSLYQRIKEYANLHRERTLLFCDSAHRKGVREFLDHFRAYIVKVYREIGIVDQYFYKHCLHALRHAGAHRLLRLTNYNYDLVAKLGGWTDAKTLKDCYGEMPEDILIEVISKLETQLNGGHSN